MTVKQQEHKDNLQCPHCGNDDPRMITKVAKKIEEQYFCEICSKEWVVIP